MVIIHIACITNNLYNGVCVVAPQHAKTQNDYAEVAFININNELICNAPNQLAYKKNFSIDDLPEPFNKPDLVVFHEAYRKDYLKISYILRKKGIPYVIIPHGELKKQAQQKKKIKKVVANILLFNKFIYGAKSIQCLSDGELNDTDFNVKKFVGTNGITLPVKSKVAFNDDRKKVVYIGRLEVATKGLDLFIEAVSREKEFLLQHKYDFYIYGPDLAGRYAQVQELVKTNNVEDIVHLNLAIHGEEKEKVLLDADIFMQTSRTEGMPTGILEALGYGIPCLVTEGTTLAQLVNNTNSGWGCKTSVEDIAKTLRKTVDDKEATFDKSHNARNVIKQNFIWDIVSKGTIEEYKKLL